jgi:multiple sugar transport system permease protein
MAGATVSLLPTLILFLFGQKYFIDGIATTGIKM